VDRVDLRRLASRVLRECVDRDISETEALARYPDPGGDLSLAAARRAVQAFYRDASLRDRNPKYARWQVSRLREYADRFEAGLDLEADDLVMNQPGDPELRRATAHAGLFVGLLFLTLLVMVSVFGALAGQPVDWVIGIRIAVGLIGVAAGVVRDVLSARKWRRASSGPTSAST
jgi:hypothetical protein